MTVVIPRVVASYDETALTLTTKDGRARSTPGVSVTVECGIGDEAAGLAALDRAVAQVRAQLEHVGGVRDA